MAGQKMALLGTKFLKPISINSRADTFSLPSIPRHFSSAQSNADGENYHDAKPSSSPKTKRALTMALLINTKPWSKDLESSLSTLSSPSLSKTTFFQTLHLIRTPSKSLHFFIWAQQFGFAHTHQSFFLMLEILGRARNLNAARNFLFSIEKKSDGAVKLDDKFFNSLIRSYGRAGLFQESLKVPFFMFHILTHPSFVPPPEASMSESYGHHARALIEAQWSSNRCMNFEDLILEASHM